MTVSAVKPEYRAAPPAIPASTKEQRRELDERDIYHRERENIERRRQLRGLLVLAFCVIAASIARAGVDRVFTYNWWRAW
jgi:hypothetical protein